MFLVKTEFEGASLNFWRAWFIGISLFRFRANELPSKLGSLEEIDYLFAFFESNSQILLLGSFPNLEPFSVGADFGAEVSFGGIIDLISRHSDVFVDNKSEDCCTPLENAAEGGEKVVSKGVGD